MGPTPEQYQLVLTTAGSADQAETLAKELVQRKLAACVNVVGPICSVYRWKGKIVQEEERLLLIKTAERLFSEVAAAIRELHTYEVPEVLALPLRDGDAPYLEWLSGCLKVSRTRR